VLNACATIPVPAVTRYSVAPSTARSIASNSCVAPRAPTVCENEYSKMLTATAATRCPRRSTDSIALTPNLS